MKRLCPLLLAAALLLSGCYGIELLDASAESDQPVARSDTPSAGTASAPEALSQSRSLTDDEIAQVNAAFAPFLEDGSVNPLGQFLMCSYRSPAEIDLTELLRYHSVIHESAAVTDPEEFAALKADPNWSWGQEVTLDSMPVPIHRIPAAEVEQLLQANLGVGLADVTYTPSAELLYLPEYNCYYNFTSDAVFALFECTAGTIQDDALTLIGSDTILSMRHNGQDWLFYSFLPV